MISSLTNPKVKYVRRLQSEKRFRVNENAFVIEGTRWVSELVRLAREPKLMFYTEDWLRTADNANILHQVGGPKQVVSTTVMAAMSDTQTAPGILAVLPIRFQPLPDNPSLLLILDGITNPGNLGTILRSAGAAGVDGVLLGPGCVDVTNPKVVRGGMGAHLRQSILACKWEEIEKLVTGLSVWSAAAEGELAYTAVPWTEPSALIIGGEASGVGINARRLAKNSITIPMKGETESLNAAVATAVILFEAVRQRNH